MRPASALLLAACLALAGTARADHATVFAGTWGPAGARQGKVFRYEGGTAWTEISPPGGLADCVWDLEWISGELWAAVHDGPPSTEDPDQPHGDSGRILKWDGATWTDMTPATGFASAVTTVSNLHDRAYITVDHIGLLRHDTGNAWDLLAEFNLAAQAIVTAVHDGRDMLYMGQDNTDEFWVHDPDGVMPCGEPAPHPITGDPRCQIPTGDACSADCHPGSCIHAFEVFDAGDGPRVYAGAWQGRMYRWNTATRLFDHVDNVPVAPFPSEHVQGLAALDGKLWAGMSSGDFWSTTDATAATWLLELTFGPGQPFSEMVTLTEDDEIWAGFGGVPWRWARRDGYSIVRSFDGATWTDRSVAGPAWGEGVLVILPVVPFINCDAGPEQFLECEGGEVEVTLDGSQTTWSEGFDLTATWTGPFIEGTADGLTPVVHFAGPGDYTCTLTLSVRGLEVACDVTIHVQDTQAPTAPAASSCLWPPNHRYRCFTLAELIAMAGPGALVDACDDAPVARVIAASSSQPEDETGRGDGSTLDDVLFDDSGACVRSERQGADPAGRAYDIVIEVTDAAGNASQGVVRLFVPHDQRTEQRCEGRPPDVGLLPHAPLPLGPDAQEGTYP